MALFRLSTLSVISKPVVTVGRVGTFERLTLPPTRPANGERFIDRHPERRAPPGRAQSRDPLLQESAGK